MIAPRTVYPKRKTQTPSELLPEVRGLLSVEPHLGLEEIAKTLGVAPWLVEAALEALRDECGEVRS